MNVVVNGLMTNYQKAGNGKNVLVLLHGWGSSIETFSTLIKNMDDYTTFSLDLPGFGGTQPPDTAWGLSDYANFVRDWLAKLGVKEPYYLLGHSFGGAVAAVGTAQDILKPKKLILLASAGIRNKKPLRQNTLRAAAKVGRIPLYLLPPNKAQRVKTKLYKRIGSDVLLVPAMRETFVKTVREDIRSQAPEITVPTLLIYADKDNETPLSDGKELNRLISNSRLEILIGGHFVHQAQPQAVASLVNEFIKEN